MTKVAEFRDLAADELRQRVKELDDQLFRLRIQKSMGQLEAPGKMKVVRRDLARIKTVLRQKTVVRSQESGVSSQNTAGKTS